MDYGRFNYLVNRINFNVSTIAEEEELGYMVLNHLDKVKEVKERAAYENIAEQINTAIESFLRATGKDSIEVRIGGGNTDTFMDGRVYLKSIYYDSTEKALFLNLVD